MPWHAEGGYFAIGLVPAGATAVIEFPLPANDETVMVGGKRYELKWVGDTVMSISPSGSMYAQRA